MLSQGENYHMVYSGQTLADYVDDFSFSQVWIEPVCVGMYVKVLCMGMIDECRPCFHFVRHLRFFLLGNVFLEIDLERRWKLVEQVVSLDEAKWGGDKLSEFSLNFKVLRSFQLFCKVKVKQRVRQLIVITIC